MDVAIEVIGWAGAVAVLAAYVLAARGVWPATGRQSAATNVVGAICLTLNGLYHGALPSVGLNLVWMGVGAATLVRLMRRGDPSTRVAA